MPLAGYRGNAAATSPQGSGKAIKVVFSGGSPSFNTVTVNTALHFASGADIVFDADNTSDIGTSSAKAANIYSEIFLAGNGTKTAPSLALINSGGGSLGFYRVTTNEIGVSANGILKASWAGSGTTLYGGIVFSQEEGSGNYAYFNADALGAIGQRNGTNPQTYRTYHTFTDTSNYERGAIQNGAGYVEFAAETAGTGTDNIDVRLTPAGTGVIDFRNPQDGTGASVGTLNNAPAAGNPAYWLKVKIGGTTRHIPAW